MTKRLKDIFWKVMAVILAVVVGVQGALLYIGMTRKDNTAEVKAPEGDAVIRPRFAAPQMQQYQPVAQPAPAPAQNSSSLIRPNAIPKININNMPGGSPVTVQQQPSQQSQNQAVSSSLTPMNMHQRMQGMGRMNIQDEFARMQAMMDQMFKNSGIRSTMVQRSRVPTGGLNMQSASPNLSEKGNNYVVKLTIPGLDESNINAWVRNNILTLSGTQTEEVKDKGQYGTSYSRSTSSFQNSFSLPGPIKDSGLKVNYENDTLTVVIPKA